MALQWLSLVATIWLQSINGTNSNFPAYSSHLKKTLSISQLQLNNLSAASDAGKLLAWIPGLAARHLSPRLVLLIGSTIGLFGYGVQYLFLAGHIHSLSYWHAFALTVLAGNSICWINTACYILAIGNFPLDQQIAVGLSTSYVGLSAKIYTALVDAIINGYNNNNSSSKRAQMFLLLNSITPLIVCVLASPLARDVCGGKSRFLSSGFLTLLAITVFTGLFALIMSFGTFTRFLPPLFLVVGLFALLLLPLVTPLAEKVRERVQQKCMLRVYDIEDLNNNSNNNNCILIGKESCGGVEDDESGDEIGPMSMLRSIEFWLYFLTYLFGATLGLVYLNNLGQIAESRGCSQTSSLVSLSSVLGLFGRLLPSLVNYFVSRKKHAVSTTMAAMGALTAPMSIAFLLLIMSEDEFVLCIATSIIGVSSGAVSSIAVYATTELFGGKNFGVNHNILVSNIPIGSFMFGGFAALVYKRGVINGEEYSCMGQKCYRTTFMIWGSLCVLGTVLAFILHLRTKKKCV